LGLDPDADGAMRIPVAFVGTLTDTFFRTTKIIAIRSDTRAASSSGR